MPYYARSHAFGASLAMWSRVKGFHNFGHDTCSLRGHFTHETESPWPLHSKHSHLWKRRSRSKLAPHYAWGTNGLGECKMDVLVCMDFLHGIEQTMFHGYLDCFQIPNLGGRPNTTLGSHSTLNAHNYWIILFLSWVRTRMNRKFIDIAFGLGSGHIWLHTTLEGPWPHYTILEVCWDGLWTLFFWALTISWWRPLARVWSGPQRVTLSVHLYIYIYIYIYIYALGQFRWV
jgi:hypothetical protein